MQESASPTPTANPTAFDRLQALIVGAVALAAVCTALVVTGVPA